MTAAMGPKVKGDAVASSPVPVETTDERRRSPRVLVDIEVDCASEDNYLFAYITDINATGIFVRTTSPEEPGTHLNLRLSADEDPEEPMALERRSREDQDDRRERVALERRSREDQDDRRERVALERRSRGDQDDRRERVALERRSREDQDDRRERVALELEGEVIWVNPYRPGTPDNLHPGMGIRFVNLDSELRDRLFELIRRFAYLS